MAQFIEVMRQAQRMCKAYRDCSQCALYRSSTGLGCAFGYVSSDSRVRFDEVERKIRAWMAEHPEPVYPTWDEWQNSVFPDAEIDITPCAFGSRDRLNCFLEKRCSTCKEQQIPADIAEKLGIKPKEG